MANFSSRDSPVRKAGRESKLLIIDDNPDQGILIEYAVRQSMPNITPVVIASEQEAMAYLDECSSDTSKVPTLILLDLYLPDRQTGWRVLEHIQQLSATLGNIPVVLISYSTSRSDINEAYDRGCSSYLSKPETTDDWLTYFQAVRTYWWETVTLPKTGGMFF
jgi:CheY-like chemotaxis protein